MGPTNAHFSTPVCMNLLGHSFMNKEYCTLGVLKISGMVQYRRITRARSPRGRPLRNYLPRVGARTPEHREASRPFARLMNASSHHARRKQGARQPTCRGTKSRTAVPLCIYGGARHNEMEWSVSMFVLFVWLAFLFFCLSKARS